MKRIIYMIIAIIGFILAIGTIGAADMEIISFSQILLQSLIASVCVGVACFGLNLEEKREANRWLRKRHTNIR